MKKISLFIIALGLSFTSLKAQSFKIGANVGIPMADAKDVSSAVYGIDAFYSFTGAIKMIDLGAVVGYRNFVGKDDFDDFQFLPLAASGRVKILGILSGGLDIGYAFGLSDNVDGGAYFRPVLNLIGLLNKVEFFVAYETISDKDTFGNLNAGVVLKL